MFFIDDFSDYLLDFVTGFETQKTAKHRRLGPEGSEPCDKY